MKKLLIIALLSLEAAFICSCSSDPIEIIPDYDVPSINSVVASPHTFRNGEAIALSTDMYLHVSVDGVLKVASAHYYIDGKEIATSRNEVNHYKAVYVAKNLSVGRHILTAKLKCENQNTKHEIESHDVYVTVIE